jgi:hypothetical protein
MNILNMQTDVISFSIKSHTHVVSLTTLYRHLHLWATCIFPSLVVYVMKHSKSTGGIASNNKND